MFIREIKTGKFCFRIDRKENQLQIDIFLSDLVYYVDYVNNKQKNIQPSIHNDVTTEIIEQNDWRGSCERNQRVALIKHQQQPYFSYKVTILPL